MKHLSWWCQRCGEPIGWLGRAIEFFHIRVHECKADAAISAPRSVNGEGS